MGRVHAIGLMVLALIFNAANAALLEVAEISASANGWDTRDEGAGCPPSGCVPGNVLDDYITDVSRWSCKADVSEVDACELKLEFDEPQDIVQMKMALYKGDERTRSVNVWIDGVYTHTITSSGTTIDFETYDLIAPGAMTVVLQASGVEGNGWLSITEVVFLIDDSLTIVTGVSTSANGWDTRVEGAGCPLRGCLPSNVLDDSIADVSRWSCKAEVSGVDACELALEFNQPQDIVKIYMAFYKGDERTRSVDVFVDGVLKNTILTSGTTRGYEAYELIAIGASTVVPSSAAVEDNGWLSISGVRFVAGEILEVPPSPSPTTSTTTAKDDDVFTLAPTSAPVTTTSTTTSMTSSTSECPSGSIPNTLDISLEFIEGSRALRLWVVEPSQLIVSVQIPLRETGMVSTYDEDGFYGGPETQNFLLLNGLSIEEDPVLGDYEAYVRTVGGADDSDPVPYTLTARSEGKVLWTVKGISPERGERSESYIINLTDYAESDCGLERYGQCPSDTFSATGAPPCEKCPENTFSSSGATFCTVDALDSLDLPVFINNAILEDAPYGFAGYGFIDVNENQVIVIEGGELEATGTVILFDDGKELPDSIALYYYVYRDLDESLTDFERGQGDVDPSTGIYSVTIPVTDGKSRVILSFVVLDEADTLTGSTNINQETVFALEVLNNDCEESYLTFTLEWDTDANLDLSVFEANGLEVTGGDHGIVGYVDVDDTDGFGPEIYRLYNGLSVEEDNAVGEYRAMVWWGSGVSTTWTLTARVAGEVAWVETGMLPDGDELTTELFSFTIDDYISYEGC